MISLSYGFGKRSCPGLFPSIFLYHIKEFSGKGGAVGWIGSYPPWVRCISAVPVHAHSRILLMRSEPGDAVMIAGEGYALGPQQEAIARLEPAPVTLAVFALDGNLDQEKRILQKGNLIHQRLFVILTAAINAVKFNSLAPPRITMTPKNPKAIDKLLLKQSRTEPGNLRTTLKNILSVAMEVLPADLGVLFPLIPQAEPIDNRPYRLDTPVIRGTLLDPRENKHESPRANGTTKFIVDHGYLKVEDLETKPEYKNDFIQRENIKSFVGILLAAEIQNRHEPMAILYLNYRGKKTVTGGKEEAIRQFVDRAAPILQRDQRLHRFYEVAKIGGIINSEVETIQNLFLELCKHASKVLNIRYFFALAVYQHHADSFRIYLKHDLKFKKIRNAVLPGGILRKVLFSEKPLLIRRQNDKKKQGVSFNFIPSGDVEREMRSMVFVPLWLRGTPLGVLTLQSPEDNQYGYEDRRVLELLGNHVATALNSIRLFINLRELNKLGGLLTNELTLQPHEIAEKIRNSTKADLVVLFPYRIDKNGFEEPIYQGKRLVPDFFRDSTPREGDIALRALCIKEPKFIRQSKAVYDALGDRTMVRKGNFEKREKIASLAVACLRVEEEPVGVLFINFRKEQRFDAPQRELVQGLASYASIAIKNSRKFTDLSRRRIRELEVLKEIDREINRSLNPQTVFKTIIEETIKHIHADSAFILIQNRQKDLLEVKYARGPRNNLKEISREEVRSVIRWVFDENKTARIDNVHVDPNFRDVYKEVNTKTVSELCVPLYGDGEVIGVLNFESEKPDAYSQEDEDFLKTLSGQVVVAIKNAQRFANAERVAKERETLIDVSKKLARVRDTERILNLILKRALKLTKSQSGNLMVRDDREAKLFAKAATKDRTPEGLSQALGQGVVGWVVDHREHLKIGNVKDTSLLPPGVTYKAFFPHRNIHSELAVPILDMQKRRTIGVINIENEERFHFSEMDAAQLKVLADLAAITIKNAENYRQIANERHKLALLNKVIREIILQVEDPHEVMKTIITSALEVTGAQVADLDLYEGEVIRRTYLVEMEGNEQSKVKWIDSPAGSPGFERGIMAYVARHQKPYSTGCTGKNPLYRGADFLQSEAAVPMSSNGELIGVLNVESPNRDAFDPDSKKVLKLLADTAVIAIQNTRNYEKAEQESRRFRMLHEVGAQLAGIADISHISDAYRIIAEEIVERFECTVAIRRIEGKNLVAKLANGSQKNSIFPNIPIDNKSVNAMAFNERRTVQVDDVEKPPPGILPQPSDEYLTLVAAPIIADQTCYGTVALGHFTANHFKNADIELIEGLANQLAITIARLETAKRARENEKMKAIGMISYDLAHRLGTGLGLISHWLGKIKASLKDNPALLAEVRPFLTKIEDNVNKVKKHGKDVKQAFIDPKMTEKRISIPIEGMFEDATKNVSDQANIQFKVKISRKCRNLFITHGNIPLILNNLVINAAQALEEGGTIILTANSDNAFVKLRVKDNGPGVPESDRSKIFELHYSTKDSSGFGLWSSLEHAKAIGGDILLEDTSQKGTTFVVSLPLSLMERQHETAHSSD